MVNRVVKPVWFALAAITLAATGCTSTGAPAATSTTSESALASTATHAPVTLTVWTFSHKQNQLDAYNAAFASLKKTYPWISVNLVGSKSDANFAQAASAGNPPDIMLSPSSQYLATYAHNGTVVDMTDLIKSSGLDVNTMFPKPAVHLSQYNGKQFALPLLADAYVLYYNKAMFAKAGISEPPKTMNELTADAKKLTVKDANGDIKTFGFISNEAYDNNISMYNGVYAGAQFYGPDGKATQGTDPKWAPLLDWNKSLIDYYGSAAVNKFVAQYNPHSEDAGNPFGTGAAAMEFNGEWHTAQLKAFTPNTDYGVAPMPVMDGQSTSAYGVGDVQGNPTYIAAKSKNIPAAFLAVQYLTTTTTVVDDLATAFGAVPTTNDALKQWSLASDPHFKPIIAVFQNPGSYDKAGTLAAGEDLTAWDTFIGQYETGAMSSKDLPTIAKKIDSINDQAN